MTAEHNSNSQEQDESVYTNKVIVSGSRIVSELSINPQSRERAKNDPICKWNLEIEGGIDKKGIHHGRLRVVPINYGRLRTLYKSLSDGKRRVPEMVRDENDLVPYLKERRAVDLLKGPDITEEVMQSLYTLDRARNAFLTDSTIDKAYKGMYESTDDMGGPEFFREIADIVRANPKFLGRMDLAGASDEVVFRRFDALKTGEGRREILALYLDEYDDEEKAEIVNRHMELYRGMQALFLDVPMQADILGDEPVGYADWQESISKNEKSEWVFVKNENFATASKNDKGFTIYTPRPNWLIADVAWRKDKKKVDPRVIEHNRMEEVEASMVTRSGDILNALVPASQQVSLVGLGILEHLSNVNLGIRGRGVDERMLLGDIYARKERIINNNIVEWMERAVHI